MKSKNTKIQFLKESIAVILVLMFMITPIVYATTSLDDKGSLSTSGTNTIVNALVNSTVSGNVLNSAVGNTTDSTTSESGGSEGSSSGSGLSWKELFYGKVGTAKKEILDKIKKINTSEGVAPIIEIENEIQLRAIAEIVNNGENNFKGITVLVIKDIKIENDVEWIPIGLENSSSEDKTDRTFQGNFWGCKGDNLTAEGSIKDETIGVKISNLEYLKEGKTYKELTNIGLFGVLGENANVQNIIIDNFNINILYDNSDVKADDKGNTYGNKNTYYYNIGNIAGINKGNIKNCFNISDIKGGSVVAGLVGSNEGTIQNCTNAGIVMGYDIVGGIAGSNIGAISNCKNTADIKGAEQDIGGIVGLLNNKGKVTLSHNTGNVQGNISGGEKNKCFVSGIVGGCYSNQAEISYCMHEGRIKYEGDTKDIYALEGTAKDDGKDPNTTSKISGCITKDPLLRDGYWDTKLKCAKQLDNEKKIFVVNDPIGYENYEVGKVWIGGSITTSATKIQNITLDEKVVFIPEGYALGKKGEGNLMFNSEFTIGSQLNVKINEDSDSDSELTPDPDPEPTPTPDLIPEPGEHIEDITTLFPKAEKGEEEKEEKDATKTAVLYTVKKGETVITDKGYFKEGEIITVKALFNKYLEQKDGTSISKDKAPNLKFETKDGKTIELVASSTSTNASNYETTIIYTYEVKESDNFEANKLILSGCENFKAKGKEDTALGISGSVNSELGVTVIADTIMPTLKAKVYVENNLETHRYTAGKEVLFEVTVSEAVNEIYTEKPLIQVSFSESGTGLYNYYKENDGTERVGIAKFRSDLTPTKQNEDGTVTWIYSYEIQERDEGYLDAEYIEYKLVDLAGNENSPEKIEKGEDVSGEEWPTDMDVKFDIKVNGKPVNELTNISKDDKLSVTVEFDKVLYTSIGSLNKGEVNKRLDNTTKQYAPSLYLNGNTILRETDITEIVTTDATENSNGTTKITYEYNFDDIIKVNKLYKKIRIRSLTLRNDSNVSVNVETYTDVNGVLPYANEWHPEYKENEIDLYGLVPKNAIKEFELDYKINVDTEKNVFIVEYDELYADTTLPTVDITTNTTDPTNAKEITYTFKFSEYVKGFEESDIIVNGGDKVEDSFRTVKEGYEYEIKVNPTIPEGKEGTLQLVIEKGACVDLVAKEIIRHEKNIIIDRVRPILESYSMKEEENSIITEFTYNESISNSEIIVWMKIDDKQVKLVRDTEVELKEGQYNYTLGIDKEDARKVIFSYFKDPSDGGKVEASFEIYAFDMAGNKSATDTVTPKEEIILKRTEIKPNPDENTYYTFEKNGNGINNFTEPTYFKDGDKLTVIKHEEKDEEEKTTTYEYTINKEIAKIFQIGKTEPAKMPYMLLVDPKVEGALGTIEFALDGSHYIDISDANIYFDVVAPNVELSVEVNEKNQNNVYAKGEELIITATTTEAIETTEAPEIRISFTNSGVGKYNNGNAKYQETITNDNGTTTWKYKYVVQNGDDGKALIEYAKEKIIKDLAGNIKVLKIYPTANIGPIDLTDIKISENTKVSFDIYKNNEQIKDFKNNTYFAENDYIKITAKFDKLLYNKYSKAERNLVNKDNAPTLTIDGKIFEIETVENDIDEYKTTITYKYTVTSEDEEGILEKLTISNEKLYAFYIEEKEAEEGIDEIEHKEEIAKGNLVNNKDITNCNLHIYNSSTLVEGEDLNVDTVKPKVSIKALYEVEIEEGKTVFNTINNPTNLNKILYKFEFSEEVEGFDIDDITVNGGTKGNLVTITKGREYQLEVTPNVAQGNEGNVQVIVEKDSCTDKVGLGNIRAENIIKVDKKAPTLLGLEAYAPTDSNITLNEKIDVAKVYYKAGDTLKIVATFDESVTTDAKLSLLFGEKNAKGEVKQEERTGNKITYTYRIADGDEGKLSVGSYRGKALDIAKNEITVTKRELSGDTIIADTTAPTLKELKVVSPDAGTYKEGNTVKIEAIFDEEIYVLDDNEIKLVDTNIEQEVEDGTKTCTNNAPILQIKFGSGKAKQMTVLGYGQKEDGSVDRTKIEYSYTIVGEQEKRETIDGKEVVTKIPGDNGVLSVDLYENQEDVKVCDIAGNVARLSRNLTGNKITADTIRPTVENITAEVEKPTIKNTGIYYKAGNEIKITVTFSEKVHSAKVFPQIGVGFSENENEEPTTYKNESYESDWNVDSETVEYTYVIEDGDNGYLWVKVPENQFADNASNGNVEKAGIIIKNVFADTTDPYYSTNSGEKAKFEIEYVKTSEGQVTGIKAVALFNEKVFSMNKDSLIPLNEIPLVGVFVNGALQKTVENPTEVVENEKTKLTYEIDVTDIDTTGKISANFINGKVYDRAGNEMSIELVDGDITSPIFQDIKVLTPNGFYKAGEKIEIVARFKEETKLVVIPTLKVRIGDKEITLTGKYSAEDEENSDTIKVARYTYTIVDGENGALNIISLIGYASDGVRTSKEISQIYIDLTDDDVNDVNAKPETLLNSNGTTYANNNEEYKNVIADTIKPYIAKVEAKVDGKVIASYTKEDGEDAITNVGRTNANELEYVITFSELVNYKSGILDTIVYNGIIKEITNNDSNKDGYCDQVIITVQPTVEGVQSLMIPDNTFGDRAGNGNVIERFNIVTTDFTKPTIRFISEYNGGIYVLPTNIGKVEIRPNVEISEDIAKIEYKWDNEEYAEIKNYSTSSDIAIPTKAFTEVGKHTLNIKVIDLAGNISETSKIYEIKASRINVSLSTVEWTNRDITVTVEFGDGLTDNRKVTFKSEKTGETVQLNAIGTDENENTQYRITENGIIYAEATDKVGNKVFTEKTIVNIDKEAPTVEIDLNSADLVIGTGKDNATIKTDVTVKDNKVLDYSKFAYIQKDIDISSISELDKAQITTTLNNEAKIENAESTKDETPYYLYVIAKDKAGNEKIAKAGPFTVLDTNEREKTIEGIEGILGEKETIPAEIEVSKLIAFEQNGKRFHITYNNFEDGEQYLNIIREKEITLSEENDGIIDYSNHSYVDVNKPTTITVVGKDACGNEVMATKEVTREMIDGPEFEVYGKPEAWTNQDIKLDVYCNEELSALTVNGNDILADMYVIVTENGNYKFIATDVYGMTSEKTIEVTKIDKDNPVISRTEVSGKTITITAEDDTSGVERYAITDTTEFPVEWSDSNEIKVSHDGAWFAWAIDKAGNYVRTNESITVDTTAPTITFNYTLLTVEAGLPIEANIITNEDAIISYSWDGKSWTTSEEFVTNVRVTKKYDITGKYTLYAKATDRFGNESKIQTIEFTVTKPDEDVLDPQIAFEGLYTTKVDGVHYVKVSTNMTSEDINNKMDKEKLYGLTPEYTNLTEDGKLKTGSEITLNGDTKYVVIVNGDVNCDGKIDFLGDIITANNYRIGIGTLNTMQRLAADIDNDGKVEFISDILAMNNYRIGVTNSL